MPSAPPTGDPAPKDGLLPPSVTEGQSQRDFGVYIHVPYCRVRCGYCDFNTYTADELGGAASQKSYATQVCQELRFAANVLKSSSVVSRPASTIFIGGGTPTLLPTRDLVQMIDTVREIWTIAADAEVTCEANPDSIDEAGVNALAAGGVTRLSIGMQSVVPRTLATLDRTHSPSRVPQLVNWARAAGMQVSVDLIYGAPGETLSEWRESLTAAISYEPDHISAYALIVEAGTKLAAQIRRGEVTAPDEDLHAEMYELADELLTANNYQWYEISNWSRSQASRSRHNLAYWQGHDWWGAGPGAHSHIGGTRWWNVKHPRAYADRIAAGESPALAREVLDTETRRIERVLLETRIAAGLPESVLTAQERAVVPLLISNGLIEGKAAIRGQIVPTLRGRLLADTVVHQLLSNHR